MSNQVYRNSQQKYYDQRGITVQRVGTSITVGNTALHILEFNSQTATYPAGPWYITRDVGTGAMIFEEEGVYSVNCVVGVSRPPAETGVPINMDIYLERVQTVDPDVIIANTLNGTRLCHCPMFIPAGTDNSPGYHYVTMTFTGYFVAGSGFRVRYQNWDEDANDKLQILGGLDNGIPGVDASKIMVTKIL